MRKVTHYRAPGPAVPARDASLTQLVSKIDGWSSAIHTLTATVDLEPRAGSAYSGVIKEYHDVRGFVLLQTPSMIRLQGQAPVVRTTIFDMVSNGEEFRLYIPPKGEFIVGKTSLQHPAKNALENLRPQHILQALIVPPIDADTETAILENVDHRADGKNYYVVIIIKETGDHKAILLRKEWYDRQDLELVRTQFYDADGTCTEDVHYSDYEDFGTIHYPAHIELSRPVDDYEVSITIEKATFNAPLPAEKFDLQKPEGVELLDLNASEPKAQPNDQ